ncbi:MAG: hypothetical protein A2170_05200 [Deltaproteobacteria bacterium RBG_13_53_10]|nr:MAG: hypothetical protein A2170_05200 [Deltaproteobacteria bacterium RBG_13_53_10]
MERERLVEIKVFGQTYTVKSDAEEEHVREVARFVNQKMEDVLKKTRSVSTLNVAILTALNIADDLLKERKRNTALFQEVRIKSKDLVERIDVRLNSEDQGEISILRHSPDLQEGGQGTQGKK